MGCPEALTLIRHDTSAYNVLGPVKEQSSLYLRFKKAYEQDPYSDRAIHLAQEVKEEFSLKVADHNTPLAEDSDKQAETMAKMLREKICIPAIIYVSPFVRTQETLLRMMKGWPELESVRVIEEERITEQDQGLAALYNDWRVFNVLNPEQIELYNLQGRYRYRYPQGENIPDVRARLRSWVNTLTRDYGEQNVLAVTHHLTILSLKANLERLGEAEFLRLDKEEKPINVGVTIYEKGMGKRGEEHLRLKIYNAKIY